MEIMNVVVLISENKTFNQKTEIYCYVYGHNKIFGHLVSHLKMFFFFFMFYTYSLILFVIFHHQSNT